MPHPVPAGRRRPRVSLTVQILAAFSVGVAIVIGVSLLALYQVDQMSAGQIAVLEQFGARSTAALADAEAEASATRTLITGVLVAAVVGTVGVGLVLAWRITKAARSLTHAISGLADGDLTVDAQVTSRDELGDMSTALTVTAASLRTLVGGIAESAGTVAEAARDLTAASAEVGAASALSDSRATQAAASAGEVDRSVQAVASGAEQMGASIKEISHSANEAARVAAHATAVADAANAKVAEARPVQSGDRRCDQGDHGDC
ncbi:HAMP domain-containing protein [Demequina litorisediminis]|uniref:HAMP domain-containing protein n=1 Tax=Demequina litorisediminis TaxID=1849022 RepID=A0ABQ6ID31_9MICO|nr:methyl-accepting chemotaxis protein [Demequina litorisediminis]GMA35614.1 hypothetical protein GCM10025876_18180 [Demequina litorisediminis]